MPGSFATCLAAFTVWSFLACSACTVAAVWMYSRWVFCTATRSKTTFVIVGAYSMSPARASVPFFTDKLYRLAIGLKYSSSMFSSLSAAWTPACGSARKSARPSSQSFPASKTTASTWRVEG